MNLAAILTGVLPSIGVLAIFVFVMRGITRADRREREAIAAYEAQQAAVAAKLTEAHGENESGASTS